ncbi:hypothetical protein QUB63_10490 [Microcoleus sp. ARI1-B5]|uniref:hypothetical protein n=1 Tax=unclassified Microcoleus TaxID=2642155 RepID=UPI002FD04322
MTFILANLDKIPPQELATIRQKAADWHSFLKEEGRGKREEVRGKKEEGRRKHQ